MAARRASGVMDIGTGAGVGEDSQFHPMSREAKKTNLKEQPWYRLNTTRKQSDDYLANTPPGAFVLRPSSAGDSHVMDVQAGPRIGHVLISHVDVNGVIYYLLPGTVHLFEHLYDLVLFCHYNPFIFEKIDGTVAITLSIAMAKKAEKINIKRKKEKALIEKEEEKTADKQRQLEEEEQRRKAKQQKEEEEKREKEERLRREAEEKERAAAEARARAEAQRLAAEEQKRREEEERARRAAEAALEAERRAKAEAEDRERRAREAEESRRIIEQEKAQREAEGQARKDLTERARRASEVVMKNEQEKLEAIERARRESEDRDSDERDARLAAARQKKQEEERARAEAAEQRRREEQEQHEQQQRRLSEERERAAEERARMATSAAPSTFSGLFKAQFIQSKKPVHVKKVKAEIDHPYSVHECLRCEGGVCSEGYKFNKFRPKCCGFCTHTHELREKRPAPEPQAEAEPKLGSRFFPRGSKITALQVQLGAVEAEAVPRPVTEVKREKAAAKLAAKQAAREAAQREREAREKSKRTDELRKKVGANPIFVVEDEEEVLDPFREPYVLMPVDNPHDEHLTAARAKMELELHLLIRDIEGMVGIAPKSAIDAHVEVMNKMEAKLLRELQPPADESNDQAILDAMAETNPAAYEAVMQERVEAQREREESIERVKTQAQDLREKIKRSFSS